jgi:hypothetical protein
VSEPPDPDFGVKVERGRRWLSDLSQEALGLGADIATESDRWFLLAVRGVGEGARRVGNSLDAVARAVSAQSARWRPHWARSRTGRERLRDILARVEKRLDVDVSREEFEAFSEKMSQLLELVFTGAISLSDVAFEAAEPDTPPVSGEPEAVAVPSTELAEEVPDQQQRDQTEERKPLGVS